MYDTIYRRSVRAKGVSSIWEAIEIRNKIQSKNPNWSVIIERSVGGAEKNPYRIVVCTPMFVEIPTPPVLKELPHPQYKLRSGGRGKYPVFGTSKQWQEFTGSYKERREICEENTTVYKENLAELAAWDKSLLFPKSKSKTKFID